MQRLFLFIVFTILVALQIKAEASDGQCFPAATEQMENALLPNFVMADSSEVVGWSSLQSGQTDFHHKSHQLRWQTVAFNVGLGTASALFATNGFLRKGRNNLQDWLDTSHQTKTIDNYLQYFPTVAVYGLKIAGVRSEHNVLQQTALLAMSAATVAVIVNGVKYTVREMRPDGSRRNSFPSGHTATAFMGAEILFQEYRSVSPWIGYCGYAMATVAGCFRVYNNRHWVNDVVAGACVGVLSTKLAYWLYPKIFGKGCYKNGSSAVLCPVVSDGGCRLCLSIPLH